MSPSFSHLVLIPAYNPGPRLLATVREALRCWRPVMVVVDGSTDGSHGPVVELARREPGLSVLELPRNRGKGAATLAFALRPVAGVALIAAIFGFLHLRGRRKIP